jgi:hypothetical protein
MPNTVTMTTYADLLKRWYVDKKNLHTMDNGKNALLMAISKDPAGEGENWTQPIVVAAPRGGGANYTMNKANGTAGIDKKFMGDWKERYDFVSVDQKVISTSKTSRGAFIPALKEKIDGLRRTNQRMTNFQLYRDEGGAIAQMGAITANATGTLSTATKYSLQYVAQGDILHFGANKNGTSLRAGGVTVQGVSPQAGTFRTSSPVAINTQVTSLTEGDYVFIAGTSGSTNQALAGLESWIPPTEALAATTFKNCDRTIDTRALGGVRIDGSGVSNEEAMIQGVSDVEQYEGSPKFIFCHPARFAQLQKELGDRKRFVQTPGKSFASKGKVDARFGFGGLALDGASGEIIVVKDSACQYGYSWVIDPDTFTLTSCGTWPFVRNADGVQMLREDGTGYLTELFAYGELICAAPGKNGVIAH